VRLVAFLIAGLWVFSLRAQSARLLPWERAPLLSWQPQPAIGESTVAPLPPSDGKLRVKLEGDGALSVLDARGVRRLRLGLPGRPIHAWRDGGAPLEMKDHSVWNFPTNTPLAGGLGNLGWGSEDFRPSLTGLLWLLEDGEGFLTLVHPATARAIHLPLPQGLEFQVLFFPDRLELRSKNGRWSLAWLALLPQLAQLGPQSEPPKLGTAFKPFVQ
jgi:hypothetical protein